MERNNSDLNLAKLNAFMAEHELPQEPQATTESSQPASEKQSGRIDIPEKMLAFAAALHGLT